MNNGDLEILNAKAEDEGFYVCSISDYEQTKYSQAYLTINGLNLQFYFLRILLLLLLLYLYN